MEILNEIYFGKQTSILRIEDYFAKLKQKYKREYVKDMKTYKTVCKDPIIRKIEKEIEDTFGFNAVTVTFSSDLTVNGYTIPFVFDDKTNTAYDINEKGHTLKKLQAATIVTSHGFKFDTKKFKVNFLMCLTLGCIFNKYLSIPEMIAICLHEIGHTFALSVMGKDIDVARTNEKFADNFAAMYGYGPELGSAFQKMNKNKFGKVATFINKIPIVNILVGIGKISEDLLNRATRIGYDPHPMLDKRIGYTITQLEQDLKDTPNINPKMRKAIEDQIQELKDSIRKDENTYENVPDRMLKFYKRKIVEYFPSEKSLNNRTEQVASSKRINQNILSIYKHQKGNR